MSDELLTQAELAEIRRGHHDVPVVERLVGEVERIRIALTDVTAVLETLLMGWRDHEADERSPEELRERIENLVVRLRALREGDGDTEQEAVDKTVGELHEDFERGG